MTKDALPTAVGQGPSSDRAGRTDPTNTRPFRRGSGVSAMGALLATLPLVLLAGAGSKAVAADCTAPAHASIDWHHCNRQNLMLHGADLAGADLRDVDFTLTDLRNADLSSARLTDAKLVRASLAGATADAADFSKAEGYRTDFSGVSAQKASFQSAELQRADFADANVEGADFGKAELGRAHFAGAILGNNSFAFANLARAEFAGAKIDGPLDLGGAYLFLTRFEGVDLSSTKGLVQSQIDIACGDAETKLPEGLTRPAKWPCGAD